MPTVQNSLLVALLIAILGLSVLLFIAWRQSQIVLPAAILSMFENTQDGILILDLKDKVVDLNSTALKILGLSDKSSVGKPVAQIWEQSATLFTDLSSDLPIKAEYASQSGFIFNVTIAPIRVANKKNIGRIVTLHNVTGREQIEKALQQQANELDRTKKLVMALSSIAARLGNVTSTQQGFELLGAELRKLDLSCGIVSVDPAGDSATIQYLSFHPELLHKIEKLSGFTLRNHVIPKKLWLGDRLIKGKIPVWYMNPHEKIRRMFPHVPEAIANQSLEMLGIQSTGQICILPLLVDDEVIGALPIWGADLQPMDDPVLSLFASQVSNILQSALIHENDILRANELSRSNAMLLSLSKVATMLENSVNAELVLETLGSEISGLGLECGIVTLDPAGEVARIKYLSFTPAMITSLEKLTGVSVKGYAIPRHYWPDDRVMREKTPVWYSDPSSILQGMFPKIPEFIAQKALDLLGFKPETQLCMLPLIHHEQIIGAMLVWGIDLHPSDSTAFTIFANQVAGILQNALAYDIEAERVKELARSNLMILALSKVAAQLESSVDSDVIIETVGKELKKMGMDSIVGILDESKQNMRIKHVSIEQNVIHWAEKVSGISTDEITIPQHLWPTDKVVTEKIAYWDPNRMKGTLKMFPIFPERFLKRAMKMADVNFEDPVCYLPLANEHEVIGILAVWGKGLKRNDETALSVLAHQLTTAIRNSNLYEKESRRAMELGILLEASEATSSSSQLNDILLSLASKLLELSSFESCYISEWDRNTNQITGIVEYSRVFWNEDKRDAYSLREYPSTLGVLRNGTPIIIQGESQAEEKKWMNELGRSAVLILPLKVQGKMLGLVEIATIKKNHIFEPHVLQACQEILENQATMLINPLSANDSEILYAIQNILLQTSGGEICSISEWDPANHQVLTVSVSTNMSWEQGQSSKRFPEDNPALKVALHEGKTSFLVRSDTNPSISVVNDSSVTMEAESMIVFPLLQGDKNIGLIELYDFNHRKTVTTDQVALLRTVADKAGFSIQNARLLQQTQMRLMEKTRLLNEKDVLLKEVHHRVKNNLQIISSLLNLQSAQISEPTAIDMLRESQNRVRTMGLIHEKLYQSDDLAQIDFTSYLQSLANFLVQSYRGKSATVAIQIDAQKIALDIDRAIPCGLIVNELLSNSLKYAFPNGQTGKIFIELRRASDQKICLCVTDDGIGLPENFNVLQSNSLGLQLVKSLVAQLDGKLEVRNGKGTSFQILFNH